MRINTPNNSLSVVFLFSILIFCSCEKETPPVAEPEAVTTEMSAGLPANSSSIHGYFYASYRHPGFSSGGYYIAVAQFGDPARDLMSNFDHVNDVQSFNQEEDGRPNVQVNTVRFNQQQLISNNPGFMPYQLLNSGSQQDFSADVLWSIQGNKSFVAFERRVPRGFPSMQTSVTTYTAYLHSGDFVLDASSVAGNYDSLTLSLGFGPTPFRAVVDKGKNLVIPRSVLQSFSSSNIQVKIKAFNYSHFVLKNKIYVFEQAHENNVILQVQP